MEWKLNSSLTLQKKDFLFKQGTWEKQQKSETYVWISFSGFAWADRFSFVHVANRDPTEKTHPRSFFIGGGGVWRILRKLPFAHISGLHVPPTKNRSPTPEKLLENMHSRVEEETKRGFRLFCLFASNVAGQLGQAPLWALLKANCRTTINIGQKCGPHQAENLVR